MDDAWDASFEAACLAAEAAAAVKRSASGAAASAGPSSVAAGKQRNQPPPPPPPQHRFQQAPQPPPFQQQQQQAQYRPSPAAPSRPAATGVFASGIFAGCGGVSAAAGVAPSAPHLLRPPLPAVPPQRTIPPAQQRNPPHYFQGQQGHQQQQNQRIAPVFAAAAASASGIVHQPPRPFPVVPPPPTSSASLSSGPASRHSAPHSASSHLQPQYRNPNPSALHVPPQAVPRQHHQQFYQQQHQQFYQQQQQQQQLHQQQQQQQVVLSASFAVAPDAAGVDVAISDSDVLRQALVGVGATWVSSARAWRIPLNKVGEAEQALRATVAPPPPSLQQRHNQDSDGADTSLRLVLEPLPEVASRILRCASHARDDSELYSRIPERLERALMAFQREGVRFALRRGGRALIGDEMGLGKTVQALAVAAAYSSEWPALIVAPSSLREAWADALGEWLGIRGARVLVVNSAKEGEAIAPGPCAPYDFVVVSYGLVGKLRPKLEASRFGIVILDESHYVKDAKAQRTRDTVPLATSAPRCLLLSGTPALARPKELFKQLDALLPSAKLTMRSFGERYCVAERPSRFGGPYDGASNLEELNRVLTASAMIRRLKKDVLTQLPPKRRQQIFLTLNASEKKQLSGLSKQLDSARETLASTAANFIASGGAGARAFGGGVASSAAAPSGFLGDATASLCGDERRAVMDAYQKTAALKVRAVQSYVEELLENGDKFLIFAHHRELLDGISFSLNKARVPFIRIDGSVAPQKRQSLVNDFQQRGDVRAAVLSITAAGTGLTLTAASVVVFAELSWTPGQVVQAEDRAHRIGQPCSVNIYYLHVKGSIDDLVWSALANKLDAVGQAVDGEAGNLAVAAAPRPAAAPGQATIEQTALFGGGAGGKKRSLAEEAAAAPSPSATPMRAEKYELDDGFSSPVRAGESDSGDGPSSPAGEGGGGRRRASDENVVPGGGEQKRSRVEMF